MLKKLHLVTASAVVGATLAVAGPALAVESTPDTEPATEMAPAATAAPVTVVDAAGVELATIAVDSVESNWSDYGDYSAPGAGSDYLRIRVTVESRVTRGTFEVSTYQFVVQDTDGFLVDAEPVRTAAEQDDNRSPVTEATLAGGESAQLELTFEVVSGTTPAQLLFEADHQQLVTVDWLS